MPLADWQITELAEKKGMIYPFDPERLNSYGYDMTLSNDFLIPIESSRKGCIIDPNEITQRDYQKFCDKSCVILPNSYILGKSKEYFRIPENVIGICLGRSSYARIGVITHVTPLEAGWEGFVVIGMSNTNSAPCRVHANKGISQVVFFRGEYPPTKTYSERGGRYQRQTQIEPSKGV